MRFRVLASFRRDFERLSPDRRATFVRVVREKFAPACDEWASAVGERRTYIWPKSLRVDELVGGRGVMEMTWSFASPDGRATFQFQRVDDVWVCTWRRIGDHGVFRDP